MPKSKADIPSAITASLVEWACSLRLNDIPDAVIREARKGLVDGIGVMVRGSTSPEWHSVAKAVKLQSSEEQSSSEEARIVGTRFVTSPYQAALLNGTAAMALELDDGYSPGGAHPTPPTLAACLAAGPEVDFDRFLLAYIVGSEVICRVSRAAHPETLRRGFHITSIAGVVGATISSGIARSVAPKNLLDAVGISGSFAGGLFEFMAGGAGVKRIHAGKAAADGVLAVDLALAGLSGPRTVLEGDNGLLRAFSGASPDRINDVVSELGSDWEYLSRYLKVYPCARHSHGPVDVVIDLVKQHSIRARDVASIEVQTYGTALKLAHFGNATVLDAQMSMPYAIAASLIYGRLTLEEFDDERRANSELRELAGRVAFSVDDSMDAAYPQRRPARVTIVTERGERLMGEVEGPFGEPYRPIPDATLAEKFLSLCTPVVGSKAAVQAQASLTASISRESFEESLNLLVKVD